MKRREFLKNSGKLIGAAVGSSILSPSQSAALLASASRGRLPENVICVAESSSSIWGSRNGRTWRMRGIPGDLVWSGIAAGKVYCIVGDGALDTCVSSDGISWKQGSIPGKYWKGIAWNGSQFCAIASSAHCAYSTDGLSWTEGSITNSGWTAIAARGAHLCVVGPYHSAFTMNGGVNWSESPNCMVSNTGVAVAANGTHFVTVGNASVVGVSTTGTGWTSSNASSGANWRAIASNGTDFCAVAYGSNKAMTSNDNGSSWTSRTLPTTANWSAITWDGTQYIAVAHGSSAAATSPDGIVWTSYAFPSTIATSRMLIAAKKG